MRYRIVGDDSGHDYYIPADKEAEWYQLYSDGDRDIPTWAVRIDGRFTFTDPRND